MNVQDEDGNSCLHLALMRGTTTSLDLQHAPSIAKVNMFSNVDNVHLKKIIFVFEEFKNVNKTNSNTVTY